MTLIRISHPQQAAAPAPSQAEQARAALDAQEAAREAKAAAQEAQAAGRVIPAVPPVLPVPPLAPGSFAIQSDFSNAIPPQVVDISIAFFVMCVVMVIGWPLARAFGKRLERRSEVAAVSPAMTEQLQRIEQTVEAMAIEIERISEAQRYMAKLQSSAAADRVALPSADRG